eukprot:1555374-Rhodomonas_salina.1
MLLARDGDSACDPGPAFKLGCAARGPGPDLPLALPLLVPGRQIRVGDRTLSVPWARLGP